MTLGSLGSLKVYKGIYANKYQNNKYYLSKKIWS